jgi:hypothetical protein
MTGDTMTVDGVAMTATLKTADGVFPVAVEAPEGAGRRLWWSSWSSTKAQVSYTGRQLKAMPSQTWNTLKSHWASLRG